MGLSREFNDDVDKYLVIRGRFIHSLSLDILEIKFAECIVDRLSGDIISFEPIDIKEDEVDYSNHFWIPGFIDLHTHAPQHLNLGILMF